MLILYQFAVWLLLAVHFIAASTDNPELTTEKERADLLYSTESSGLNAGNEDDTQLTRIEKLLETFLKSKEKETADQKLWIQVTYFIVGAVSTLVLCIVISTTLVVNGVLWQRCVYTPAYLQQGRRSSQTNNYQSNPRSRPKPPAPYGDHGDYPPLQADYSQPWGFNGIIEEDDDVYYSIPYEDAGRPTYSAADKKDKKTDCAAGGDEDDDMEIEDNAIYNVQGGDKKNDKDDDDDETMEDNVIYNVQGDDNVKPQPSTRDHVVEIEQRAQAEEEDRQTTHATNSDEDRQVNYDKFAAPRPSYSVDCNRDSVVSNPPENIIQSLAIALKERKEKMEREQQEMDKSNSAQNQIYYVDDPALNTDARDEHDDQNLYGNIDVGAQDDDQPLYDNIGVGTSTC